jgi:hypothetical protein
LREDRVWLAGVFLPLSVRGGLDPRYGTRHRAALGLTEQTDSFVFVVSEERRLVSIAFRAEIHHVESPDELRLKVQELLSMEEVEVTSPTGFAQATTATPTGVPPVAVPTDPPPEALSPEPPSAKVPTPEVPLMGADLSAAPPLVDNSSVGEGPLVALPGDGE